MTDVVNYTQEQVDALKNEWMENEFNPVAQERDGLLQYKPVEKSEAEVKLETDQQELTTNQIQFELKSVGLEKFAGFFNAQNVDEAKAQIETFNALLAEVKADMGYVPNNHASTDPYTKFEKEKDTKGMISSKLANLFK